MIKVFQVTDQESLYPKLTFTYGMKTEDGRDIGFQLKDNLDKYEHVANIAADDLDIAYKIGNIGPESDIKRKGSMHSISVGDILEKDGEKFIVARVGFEKLEEVA